MFPVVGHLGRAVVDQKAAAGVHAAFEVRVRGGGAAVLRFHDGDLTVDGVGASVDGHRCVDCHLSVGPAAFLRTPCRLPTQVRAEPAGGIRVI